MTHTKLIAQSTFMACLSAVSFGNSPSAVVQNNEEKFAVGAGYDYNS